MPVETELNHLTVSLKNVPTNMRLFSLSMRSLYAEKKVSDSSEAGKDLKKIRDDTRKDAMVYIKGVLPVSTEVVRILKEYFEYYEKLSLEEWKKYLPDILKSVKGYRQCCEEIVNLHKQIIIPLKKREDEAKKIIGKLKNLTKELEKKKAELEKAASGKRAWAFWLSFVPVVGRIATPLLNLSANSKFVEAVADGGQCIINNSAIVVVQYTLIPALTEFIEGLGSIAGFFLAVEEEIVTFQTKGEMAKKDPIKLHYIMMNNIAKEINQSCTEFFAVIPQVQTDFSCIPESENDENYVDEWLKKQQNEIKKKYKDCITEQLSNFLTYLSTNREKKLMIGGKD